MSTYGYSKRVHNKNNGKKVAAIIFGVAVIAFVIVGGKTYFMNKKVNDTKEALTRVEEETIKLQEEIQALGGKIEGLEKESEKLESILWRFEPIVIPDSMK